MCIIFLDPSDLVNSRVGPRNQYYSSILGCFDDQPGLDTTSIHMYTHIRTGMRWEKIKSIDDMSDAFEVLIFTKLCTERTISSTTKWGFIQPVKHPLKELFVFIHAHEYNKQYRDSCQ